MGKRRGNGEGSIYEFIQRVKKNNNDLEVCETCQKCKDWSICDNRENCKNKCDKCKNCKKCLVYCDRYYVYDRHASQSSKKNGERTTPIYSKKRKEATQKNLETLSKINQNKYTDKSKVTLYELAKDTVEYRKDINKTKSNSYATNCSILKRLAKYDFMNKPAQEVNVEDIKMFFASLANTLSENTFKKDIRLVKSAVKLGISKEILTANIFDNQELLYPKSKKKNKKIQAFTIEEERKFLNNLLKEKQKYKWAWLLSMFSDMRIGEVYALNINQDLDFEEEYIYVNNTITRDEKGKYKLGDIETKTYAGTRKIKLNDILKEILKHALEEHIDNNNNLLFCRTNGEIISESASNSAFKRFCEKHQIAQNKRVTQYMLRHTGTTRDIESGMPPVVVQKKVGHVDISTTLDTYTDVFEEFQNKCENISYNYYIQLGLFFHNIDINNLALIDLDKIINIIKTSKLNEADKDTLMYIINTMKQKYSKLQNQKDNESKLENIV